MIRPYFTDVHAQHTFKYAPHEAKLGAKLFGVELEVSCKGRNKPETVSNEVDKLLSSFCICAFDRSVHNGFEIKAAAATYAYHLTAWDEFFAWNAKHQKLNETHKSCGTHITVERATFFTDNDHAGRFVCFINANGSRRIVEKIAERQANEYCPYERVGVKSVFSGSHCQHKSAVHTHKGGGRLIEVRIFQGVVTKASLLKNIEFVAAVADFTRIEVEDYRSARVFLKWIRTEGRWKNYPNLYPYLKACGLIKPQPVKPEKLPVRRTAIGEYIDIPEDPKPEQEDSILLPPKRRGRPRKTPAPIAIGNIGPLKDWEINFFNEVWESANEQGLAVSEVDKIKLINDYAARRISFGECASALEIGSEEYADAYSYGEDV